MDKRPASNIKLVNKAEERSRKRKQKEFKDAKSQKKWKKTKGEEAADDIETIQIPDSFSGQKKMIAYLSEKLMENPEKYSSYYPVLLELCSSKLVNEKNGERIKHLSMKSLAIVYKDTIPSYSIRKIEEDQSTTMLKRKVRERIGFEQCLLSTYSEYISLLRKICPGYVTEGNYADSLMRVSQECCSILLANVVHFNHTIEIVNVVVRNTNSRVDVVAQECANSLIDMFDSDKSGEFVSQAVKVICKYARSQKYNARRELLLPLLHLKFQAELSDVGKDKANSGYSSKIGSRINQKEISKKVERDFSESVATVTAEKKMQHQSQIIHSLFMLYFRVLREHPESNLFPTVIRGIAAFSPYISIELAQDLIGTLRSTAMIETLSVESSIECIYAAFSCARIISGEYNFDFQEAYEKLYQLILEVDVAEVPLLLKSLNIALQSNPSTIRTSAMAARLVGFCVSYPPSLSIGCLLFLWKLIGRNPHLIHLLDSESSELGDFNNDADGIEGSNASASVAWGLSLMRHSYNKQLSSLVSHFTEKKMNSAKAELPNDMFMLLNKPIEDISVELKSTNVFSELF